MPRAKGKRLPWLYCPGRLVQWMVPPELAARYFQGARPAQTVATITGVVGGKQITINGLPIYTFSKDTKPGDTNGQGVLNIWHVLSPAGEKITTPNPK